MIPYPNSVDTRDFSTTRLGVNFTTDRPISADDLAESLKGMAALYKREVIQRADPEQLEGSEFLLYITKIESNCIYTELAGCVATALPFINAMDYVLIIDGFQHRFRDLVGRFANRDKLALTSDRVITLTEAKEFAKVVKAAGNGGVTMERKFYKSPSEFSVEERLVFDPSQIQQAREGVIEYIEENTQREDADFKKVSLYFDRLNRVNRTGSNRSAERGTIEEISTKSLPVRWVSEMDDQNVKSIGANLFDLVFNVDVKVDSVRGNPVAYRVLKLHDWQPLDGESHPELPE